MEERFSSLAHAVRWPVLGKYLGQLLLALGVLILPPIAVALLAGEFTPVPRYLLAGAVLCALGWPLSRLQAPDRLQGNEAMVIVTLAFALDPLVMACPLTASGLSYTDALFEAVSGITTTGLTMLNAVHDKSHLFLFTRAWMQWYGGLGFVVLTVALIAQHGLAGRKLVETSGAEILVSTSRAHARGVLVVYLVLTTFAFAMIWAAGLAPFAALAHALAAVSTGGFSPFDESLGGDLPAFVPWAVEFACFLGAVSFTAYYAALRGKPVALWEDVELRTLALLCALWSAILVIWFAAHGLGLAQALHHGILLAVSAQSTAGFSTMEPASLSDLPKGVLILAMLIGGSVGSTAGGAKILRFLLLLRLVQLSLRRASVAEHAVVDMRLGGKVIGDAEFARALLMAALFWAVILVSWLVFLAYGYPALNALFEVVSATATVGLSTGVTSTLLPTPLKLLLCLDMLAGRLEIMALLVILYPPTWIGGR